MRGDEMQRKLFCNINPTCYAISLKKERILRRIKDVFSGLDFADTISNQQLPHTVKSHSSVLIRNLHGVDLKLQENKVKNIQLACEKLNGIVIYPNETFSFWRTVGYPTKKKGYKEGLVIRKNHLSSGIGGGLCQMSNMIHWLVLNSPLEVTEHHHHSDALFPDERRRVPFGTGTSVLYNHIDYRFKNTTDVAVQLLLWCENGELCGELRSEKEFSYRYKLEEKDHHFEEIDGKYFRVSKVYKNTIDRRTNEVVNAELVLDNHSAVLYDYDLIPKDQIRVDVYAK